MSRLIAVCKSLIGSVGGTIAPSVSPSNLFIPSGSDSLITSDGNTFKHAG